ncbi:TetR/AcrR family transcriptional regulator [Prolixibacter denitrificans]|uniref:AcrR family transcriptional regulator n=1 Tax=Prolixibacter denitrificans TaxID=1541063 RepID=A0A2P8CF70_9BACT|nr:TetR/AcrR family transcriptional regulator [Prolixibacter denitrificans]PSK83621.1 AcrR family transcriptional regulator [Prolixibacter denitrificans]GET23170.1 TetR family transcriptional regulator [Prolixibacter denitrificans]
MNARERIMMGAMDLFARDGIRSVTMDAIATELGVSKRSIYENFKDKTELLREGIIAGGEVHGKTLNEIVNNSPNVIDALYRIGKENHQVMQKINPRFFSDLKKHYPEILALVTRDYTAKSRKFMLKLFRQGAEEGVFEKNINMDIVASVWMQLVDLAQNTQENDVISDSWSVKEWHFHLFMPYLRGISTDKGRKLIDQYLESFEGVLKNK